MNLYIIYQKERNGYDTYDSAVVAADSCQEAVNIHPSVYCSWDSDTWASCPENVSVEYLGIAKEGTKKGVVLASFNAG